MPIEEVPPYLIETVRDTHPDVVAGLVADGKDRPEVLIGARNALERWANDSEFWNEVDAAFQSTTMDGNLDIESQVVSAALEGDRRLAEAIILEAPTAVDRPRAAVQAITIIREQCDHVLEQPPTPGRLYRTARILRRVFKAAGGGVLIAADIIAPDPTGLVKVASIWGGLDMIIDAANG